MIILDFGIRKTNRDRSTCEYSMWNEFFWIFLEFDLNDFTLFGAKPDFGVLTVIGELAHSDDSGSVSTTAKDDSNRSHSNNSSKFPSCFDFTASTNFACSNIKSFNSEFSSKFYFSKIWKFREYKADGWATQHENRCWSRSSHWPGYW